MRKFKKALSLTLAITIIISATFGTSLISFATTTADAVLSCDMTDTNTTPGAALTVPVGKLSVLNGITGRVPLSFAGTSPFVGNNKNVRRFTAIDNIAPATSGQFIKVPNDSTINDKNTTTMEIWIKPTISNYGSSNTPTRRLLSKTTGASEFWNLTLYGSTLRYQRKFTTSTGGTAAWVTNDCVANNKWNHIVVTYDASSASNNPIFYVNGLKKSINTANVKTVAASGDVVADGTSDLYIGAKITTINATTKLPSAFGGFAENYNGDMGPVRLYNTILTPTEISSNYNSEKFTFLPAATGSGSPGRESIENMMTGWKLWRDTEAQWLNDALYTPSQTDIYSLSLTAPPPTLGWKALDSAPDTVSINLPATVEEFFTADGTVGDKSCQGVSWFWKDVEIPADWEGKTLSLTIGAASLRAEVYANETLVGYNLITNTPYSCDLSSALHYGETNRIAIRITNPGGQRGWPDFFWTKWGNYFLPAYHDFGGIYGEVSLTATNNTYVDDVYVQNLNTTEDFRSIAVQTTIHNRQSTDISGQMSVQILPKSGGNAIFEQSYPITVAAYELNTNGFKSTVIKKEIHCPNALLWNVDTPNLYVAKVTFESNTDQQTIKDVSEATFGFRVFEVNKSPDDDRTHFYINGKRETFKSAIDWGYYALTGAYATEEMAKKSVQAAKDIGQNAINFHRQIGDNMILDKADEMGLFLYEEPGGFRGGGQGYRIEDGSFAAELIEERVTRMVMRDRSRPSLVIYNLCNEDDQWYSLRERVMKRVHELDFDAMVSNTSGGDSTTTNGEASIEHMRPYEDTVRTDYQDIHTVGTGVFFDEKDFNMHNSSTNVLTYWGEVKCYTGPENWYSIGEMYKRLKIEKGEHWKGYNYSYYTDFSSDITNYYGQHDWSNSGIIKTAYDLSIASGHGKMYNDGRNSQTIMAENGADGYAINGWSSGNGTEGANGWYSGIVDDARNLKGDAKVYNYYTRPLQIAISRKNGKYFTPTNTPKFKLSLINQGALMAGQYTLMLQLRDGAGNLHSIANNQIPVTVAGGDIYAQLIQDDYSIALNNTMHGGYMLLVATLVDSSGQKVADGMEQILLTNRASYQSDFVGLNGAVLGWAAAKNALTAAQANPEDYSTGVNKLSYIAASGTPSEEQLTDMLRRVKDDGTTLLVKFDSTWAQKLYEKNILSAQVTNWEISQNGFWNGNGFGYLEKFTGNTGLLNDTYTDVNSWEFSETATGFYPFESQYLTKVYGTFLARPGDIRVMLGSIKYGQGTIILAPAYTVDKNQPMNDLLFYNMISMPFTGMPDGIIANSISIYSGDQKLEAIPQASGKYNVKSQIINNSDSSNSAYYIITVNDNNRLISIKTMQKTFDPYKAYTFDDLIDIPSAITSPNLVIKCMILDDLRKIRPLTQILELKR